MTYPCRALSSRVEDLWLEETKGSQRERSSQPRLVHSPDEELPL